ncbi:hypothetical protein PN466_20390 [Roseofilum reptotaenium CS-1145]|uniref:Uncharacterized protein n=1 Tax=Roseofilum reptotaenium AO1-A TaxID=1925591 RepID=A0A1L9QX45_9CYAN|nr:hypothetical protein [Roseofilum reptotaenium]MDB9519309.1 hypothetical protein [Roseofilum reptotaenium CS-1145]OJJ27196.1 hypothetical protein BI308_01525 [Roseofilum reptotaenium AO1-A]
MINSFPVINPETTIQVSVFLKNLLLFIVEKVIIPLAKLSFEFAMANPNVIAALIVVVAVVLIVRWSIKKGYIVDFGINWKEYFAGLSIRPA